MIILMNYLINIFLILRIKFNIFLYNIINMNCIFCCIFNEEKYINMFYLLLESLFIYGDLDDNTEILIYTSTLFMNKIIQSHLFHNEKMKFEINDIYNNNSDIFCKEKLDIFNISSINNYNKILYLDIDIIVKDNINKIFDICKEDILYTVKEGTIINLINIFGDNINNYNEKSAFTTKILLFNNCEKIKNLFNNINEDILKRNNNIYNEDYIIYNAFKYNLYNNENLNSLIINNDDIYSNKIIHYFSNIVENFEDKIIKINNFLNNIKDLTINNNINKTKEYINNYLLPIIYNSNEDLEGNIFMLHCTTVYTDIFIDKVKNISNLLLNKNIKNVMEIGFNSGFSTLLMLISNQYINISCFDLGNHKYTIPCYENLKKTFGKRINITLGDSRDTLKNINNKYDLIHIDGGHLEEIANNDIINSYKLSKKGTIIIMDDYNFDDLHKLWDNYILRYNLKKLDINICDTPYHDIKYV